MIKIIENEIRFDIHGFNVLRSELYEPQRKTRDSKSFNRTWLVWTIKGSFEKTLPNGIEYDRPMNVIWRRLLHANNF